MPVKKSKAHWKVSEVQNYYDRLITFSSVLWLSFALLIDNCGDLQRKHGCANTCLM